MILASLLLAAAAAAQPVPAGALPQIFGPPPPVPPAVIARDAAGGVTVRAVRVDTPLRIDGRLDEAVYDRIESMSEFIQNDPAEGAPASERTEVWLLFDQEHVYVVARCWETRPDRIMASEMRRDNTRIVRDDNFAWSFDPFYSRRNGVLFEVSAVGGRLDAELTNESQLNMDWNPVYDVAVSRFEGGWTMEAALPFKSLRYPGAGPQIWGFQARRVNRWRNESSYLTPLSAAQGMRGHFRASLAATLVGIEAPEASRLLEVKPYVIGDVTTAASAGPASDLGGDLGIDIKYGITQGLTADFTANPDFAQVEADEQQINLTRFSLFFPEKREFFLENQGVFGFGGASTSGRLAGVSDTPILFYSRRIGLQGTREVPLRTGGRLTGRVGPWTLGALNIQARELGAEGELVGGPADELHGAAGPPRRPAAQQRRRPVRRAVAQPGQRRVERRVRRRRHLRLLRRPDHQHPLGPHPHRGPHRQRHQLPRAPRLHGRPLRRAARAPARRRALQPRGGVRAAAGHAAQLRRAALQPAPRVDPSGAALRRHRLARLRGEPRTGDVETREATGLFTVEWENSDQLSVSAIKSYEFLPEPFPIAPDVTIPVDGYDFTNLRLGYNFGQQRRFSANVMAEHGSFYGGQKTTLGVSRGRVSITDQFSVEPSWSINWIDLPQGAFTTNLVGTRTTYTMTPLMFASALVQYNSRLNRVSANIRFRWEYRPGSEIFVVFNEDRNTEMERFPLLRNRAFIVKVNRLFRF